MGQEGYFLRENLSSIFNYTTPKYILVVIKVVFQKKKIYYVCFKTSLIGTHNLTLNTFDYSPSLLYSPRSTSLHRAFAKVSENQNGVISRRFSLENKN